MAAASCSANRFVVFDRSRARTTPGSTASTAASLARRLKAITDVPVLIGVGVSNAAQAREAVQVADGVVMGASVIRRLLDDGPDAAGEYIAEVRAAIDA